jgi:hypothetical protein
LRVRKARLEIIKNNRARTEANVIVMNDDDDVDVDARFVECGNGYGRVVSALYI